jgi:autotransporter passenger strand-loop-strand repeat protein
MDVGATASAGSTLIVSAGGTTSGTVLTGAGERDAGSAVSTSLVGGSWMSVESGGVASATTVSNSVLFVSGTASGTQVNVGGTERVVSGGVDVGAQINSAGLEVVSSGGTASSATISGGTLEVASGGSTGSGAVTFAVSGGGTLRLDDSAHFGGLVAGFGQGDLVDLRDIAFTSATTLSWTQLTSDATASGTLTVSGGGSVANIELLGQYSVGQFSSANDGHGGTVIGATELAGAALSATLAASA